MTTVQADYGELFIEDIIIDAGFNVFAELEEKTLFELGNSMAQDGQLVPVLVNQTGDEEYHLIAGQQRVTALKKAGIKQVECKIFQGVDSVHAARMHMIENIRRRTPRPMEEARGMQRLSELGQTTAQIAGVFGVSDDTVLRRMKLLDLEPAVQRMIERAFYPLPIHQAHLLTGLSPSDQIQLARQIAPTVGPIMGEKEARVLVEETTKGPELPDPGPATTPEKTPPREPTNIRTDPDNISPNRSQSPPSPPPVVSPEQKKNAKAAEKLKAVHGMIGVPGQIGIDADGQLTISGIITIRMDRKTPSGDAAKEVYMAKVEEMPIELGADKTAEVIKLLKKCQPKPAKKKTAQKKDAKK